MKTKILSVLICSILSCFIINGYAQQVGNTKTAKTVSSQNFNLPHFHRPWLTTGNSGTDTAINFIGTRDAQPLLFKVNNQKAGFLDFNNLSRNTAFGYQTLTSDVVSDISGITGADNTAVGYVALYANTTGEVNTAIGSGALAVNIAGNVNTATGGFSLNLNTNGAFNTANGSFSLASNTEGGFNTATGAYALSGNTTGSFNIATGTPFTLSSNTEGSDNIATGALALNSNTTGNANVAYGSFSLASNVTGNKNTALGDHADVTAGNLHNATAIGNKALVDASNKIRVGNNSVSSIGGAVGWTNYSDERIKDNVEENVPGLEFIKALRPVTYHFNVAKENALLGVKDISAKDITMPQLKGIKLPGGKEMKMPAIKDIANLQLKNISDEDNEIEKIQFTGFLAQDVDKAAKNIGYDFSGIDKSGKIMGLRYSDFVVPLVKAVQELSKMNDEKDAKIEGLQKQIDELRAAIPVNAKSNLILSNASLEQNMPNPFNSKTIINYSLPQKFVNAQIIVTDNNGKILKRVTVSGAGRGTVNIDAALLSAGTYNYALIVDDRVVSSKQMILKK